MMQISIGHAGHWAAGLLYLTPVVLLGLGVLYQRYIDRKEGKRPLDEQ